MTYNLAFLRKPLQTLKCSSLLITGFYSWRHSTKGSWFVQALSNVLEEHGTKMDLLSLMTRVNKNVAYEFQSNSSHPAINQKKQIPCITSMLTKDVIFTPKS